MTPGLGASMFWFVVVIALIPLVLWLLKRTPLAGGVGGKPGLPRTLAVLPLSAQHKLVTVEVGQGDERRWLVLGVSPQGMRTLHRMTPQGDAGLPAGSGSGSAGASFAAPPGASFAALLARLRGGRQS